MLTASLVSLIVLVATYCPINFKSNADVKNVKFMACAGENGSAVAAYQKSSNSRWHARVDGSARVNITQFNTLGTAESIKTIPTFLLAKFGQSLHKYTYTGGLYHPIVSGCTIVDYTPLSIQSIDVIFILCQSSLKIHQINSSLSQGSSINVIQQIAISQFYLTTCLWIKNSSVVLIGTTNGSILMFDLSSKHVFQQVKVCEYPITFLHMTINEGDIKIYAICQDNTMRQYFLNDNILQLERNSSLQIVGNISDIQSSGVDFILLSTSQGIIIQLDIQSGHLLYSMNLSEYITNKADMGLDLLFLQDFNFKAFNPLNPLSFVIKSQHSNNSNQLVLMCQSMNYYNGSGQRCRPCNSNCTSCDPTNGYCFTCTGGHFLDKGQCYSCFYQDKGLTGHLQQCFSTTQQSIMQNSQLVVKSLSFVVNHFATFLKMFGMLFLFVKLVNYWNLISIYVLVGIPNMPFFLSNILTMLFNTLHSSVLQTLNIDLRLSFGVQAQTNNILFQAIGGSTDFMAFNAQNIFLFIYAVILIITVHQLINFALNKCGITIFEDNLWIAILQQFIGSFTTSLIPVYYIVLNAGYSTPLGKFNVFCFYMLTGFAIILPFLFIIMHSDKPRKTNKVANINDNMPSIEVVAQKRFKKRFKALITQINRQGCFAAVLSFSIPLLACHVNPLYFILIVGLAHILSIYNSFFLKNWRINTIIQKVSFFCFHLVFSSLAFIDDNQIKFYLSILAVAIIILGGTHEIITSIAKKIHFWYVLIRGKIQEREKIQRFLQKNKQKVSFKTRAHPVNLNNQSLNNKNTIYQHSLDKRRPAQKNKKLEDKKRQIKTAKAVRIMCIQDKKQINVDKDDINKSQKQTHQVEHLISTNTIQANIGKTTAATMKIIRRTKSKKKLQ